MLKTMSKLLLRPNIEQTNANKSGALLPGTTALNNISPFGDSPMLESLCQINEQSSLGMLSPVAGLSPLGRLSPIGLLRKLQPALGNILNFKNKLMGSGNALPGSEAKLKLQRALQTNKNLEKELLRQRLGQAGQLSLAISVVKASRSIKQASETIARLAQTNAELAQEYRESLDKLTKRFKLKLKRAKKLLRNQQQNDPTSNSSDLGEDKFKKAKRIREVYESWANMFEPSNKASKRLIFSMASDAGHNFARNSSMPASSFNGYDIYPDAETAASVVTTAISRKRYGVGG